MEAVPIYMQIFVRQEQLCLGEPTVKRETTAGECDDNRILLRIRLGELCKSTTCLFIY